MASIWDRYPDLSGSELRTLVAAAAQVLAEGAEGADLPPDPIEMSTGTAARELTAVLGAEGGESEVRDVLADEESAVELSRAVLDQVRTHPDLADAVAAAYDERTRKMSGAEVLLLAGALVVLATRIKEIRTGKQGTRITFTESGAAVKAFLAGLVASLRGL